MAQLVDRYLGIPVDPGIKQEISVQVQCQSALVFVPLDCSLSRMKGEKCLECTPVPVVELSMTVEDKAVGCLNDKGPLTMSLSR
jgi:hypothetical protein